MKLLDLLKPAAILLNVEVSSSEEAIKVLGDRLHKLGFVDDNFVEATLKREEGMPTGLPLMGDHNAALPHVDLEYVKSPAVALATLKSPVNFRQMVETEKQVSVRLVIMLALNEPKAQVEMLGQVSTLLQNSSLVEQLLECEHPEEVLELLVSM